MDVDWDRRDLLSETARMQPSHDDGFGHPHRSSLLEVSQPLEDETVPEVSGHGSAGFRVVRDVEELQDGGRGELEEDDDCLALIHSNRPYDITPSAEMPYDLDNVSEVTDANYLENSKLIAKREDVYNAQIKSTTTAAIKRARTLGRNTFSKITNRAANPGLSQMPIFELKPATESAQRERLSWAKRPVAAVNQFFIEHPFWGEPADDPAAILLREWGVKVRKGAKRRARRTPVRPVEKAVDSTVLDEKTDAAG